MLLALEEDDVEQISRFRTLTPEQRAMILSARKSPGKYTEGTVMSGYLLNLFPLRAACNRAGAGADGETRESIQSESSARARNQ